MPSFHSFLCSITSPPMEKRVLRYQLWDQKTLTTFWLNASVIIREKVSPQLKLQQGFPISKLVSDNSPFIYAGVNWKATISSLPLHHVETAHTHTYSKIQTPLLYFSMMELRGQFCKGSRSQICGSSEICGLFSLLRSWGVVFGQESQSSCLLWWLWGRSSLDWCVSTMSSGQCVQCERIAPVVM